MKTKSYCDYCIYAVNKINTYGLNYLECGHEENKVYGYTPESNELYFDRYALTIKDINKNHDCNKYIRSYLANIKRSFAYNFILQPLFITAIIAFIFYLIIRG